jgi:hypothetical protein
MIPITVGIIRSLREECNFRALHKTGATGRRSFCKLIGREAKTNGLYIAEDNPDRAETVVAEL